MTPEDESGVVHRGPGQPCTSRVDQKGGPRPAHPRHQVELRSQQPASGVSQPAPAFDVVLHPSPRAIAPPRGPGSALAGRRDLAARGPILAAQRRRPRSASSGTGIAASGGGRRRGAERTRARRRRSWSMFPTWPSAPPLGATNSDCSTPRRCPAAPRRRRPSALSSAAGPTTAPRRLRSGRSTPSRPQCRRLAPLAHRRSEQALPVTYDH